MPPGSHQGCIAQKLQQAVAVQGAPHSPAYPPATRAASARNQAVWKTSPAKATPPTKRPGSAEVKTHSPRAASAHEKPSAPDPASPSSPRYLLETSPPPPANRPQTSRPPRPHREIPRPRAARHPATLSCRRAEPPPLPALSPPQAPQRHPASGRHPPTPRNPPNHAMSTGLSTPEPKRPHTTNATHRLLPT